MNYLNSYKVSGPDLYTDADGIPSIPIGTLTIQETQAPTGYLPNDTLYTIRFYLENGDIVSSVPMIQINSQPGLNIQLEEDDIDGKITVIKQDSGTNSATPQGDAVISGIRFAVINRCGDGKNVIYNNATYGNGQVITILETKADGTTDATGELPYGTYQVVELRMDATIAAGEAYDGSTKLGSSPLANATGYLFNSSATQNVSITQNSDTPVSVTFKDDVLKGGVKVIKWDAEKNKNEAQGDADFSYVRYEIYNRSAAPVVVNGNIIAVDALAATIDSNADGVATSGMILPYGTYSIKESSNSGSISYNSTDTTEYTFKITENNQEVDSDTADMAIVFKNSVLRSGVVIGKIDRETDTNTPQGMATLSGAEFTIYNNSGKSVIVEGAEYAVGEAVKVLTTGSDGTVRSAIDLLPYGTYYVKETKAPEGYLLNSDWRVDFRIRVDGEFVYTTGDLDKVNEADDPYQGWFKVTGGSSTNPAECPDDIKRADISWIKCDVDGSPMANIPFMIERLDESGKAVETHIIVTDSTGRVNTASRPKTGDKVNSLDAYVVEGKITDESKIDSTAGVWFGEQSAKEAGQGSLIYANYRITEVKCEANKEHDVLLLVLFSETDMAQFNEVFFDGQTYDLAAIFFDLVIHPESDLLDVATGSKSVAVGDTVSVTDTIIYDNLKRYNHYKVVTEIYYKDTEGNTPVLLGSTGQEFDPPQVDSTQTSHGTIENTVIIDTTGLDGGTIHAVDRFYVKHEDSWTELINHNMSMSDPRQMLNVPILKTNASDKTTGTQVGTVGESETVVDHVTYEGLTVGRSYEAEGTLHYLEDFTDANGVEHLAGDVLLDEKGDPIVVTQTFVPEEADGSVDLTYADLDTRLLQGRSIVVYENLYLDHVLVAMHADLHDDDQRIDYPDILTSALDADSEDHVGSANEDRTLTDYCLLTNLRVGEEYQAAGTVMDEETEEALLDEDGNEITAQSEVFIATATEMIVPVTFTINAEVAGKTIVVFEDLLHKGVIVAVHHDINDEEQSIHYPEIGTTAIADETEDHVVIPGEGTKITDTVHYENLLTEGRTYVTRGTKFETVPVGAK